MGIFKKVLKRTQKEPVRCTAVVPAAGTSQRMGEEKLFLSLGSVPVILRTLRVLDGCPDVTEIVVVTRKDLVTIVGQLCGEAELSKVHKIVVGGKTRTESVLSGVREAESNAQLVAVHDAARPLITEALISRTIRAAKTYGAAAPAVPVKDTVKRAVGGVVENTLNRSELYAVQTPQVFERDLLQGALERAIKEKADLTDDCSAVERLGMRVKLIEGSYENLKLTTPEDLATAEAILTRRK